jgi:hypothetical protein
MIVSNGIDTASAEQRVYDRAIRRIERDLGWGAQEAHQALAHIAQANGVFLDDVAEAILGARSIKRGLAQALRQVQFRRRP